MRPHVVLIALAIAALTASTGAQAPQTQTDPLADVVATAAKDARVAEQSATLVFTNRPIVEFRAIVLGRAPSTRVTQATELLNQIVDQNPHGRVSVRSYPDGVIIVIDDRVVFGVVAADVDPLAGESLARKGSEAAARLQQAFAEGVELRTPRRLLWSIGFAIVATLLYVVGIVIFLRVDRRVAAAANRAVERRLREIAIGGAMVQASAPIVVRRLVGLIALFAGLLLTYGWLTAVLRRFPYTRPWGESLRSALVSAVAAGGRAVIDQLPNLVTVLAIVLVTRFLVRLVGIAFKAVEEDRAGFPGVHPETAQPTRRIAVALLWLFALVVSYKYLPGSESDVFKGVSVFVGLIISLGSSGVMNQVMSGLMLTYSRALRVDDFVRIGDVEGTVTHLGTLSTKVRTPRNEEITIPNAVVVANATTNFSRFAADGVYMSTSVTIGYDAPWRQIEALLLLAADRTSGVRKEPKPIVLQTGLGDFYVHYTLLVCVEQPRRRNAILHVLHANIQDAFNEYGVQIMSPNYEADPEGRKIVPPSDWYAAPATPPAVASGGVAVTHGVQPGRFDEKLSS